MNPIYVMHETYGKSPEHDGKHARCGECHFFHWKIEGKKENRYQAYRWCEVYGLNKKDVMSTDWKWDHWACGWYNQCRDAPQKNLYKKVGK